MTLPSEPCGDGCMVFNCSVTLSKVDPDISENMFNFEVLYGTEQFFIEKINSAGLDPAVELSFVGPSTISEELEIDLVGVESQSLMDHQTTKVLQSTTLSFLSQFLEAQKSPYSLINVKVMDQVSRMGSAINAVSTNDLVEEADNSIPIFNRAEKDEMNPSLLVKLNILGFITSNAPNGNLKESIREIVDENYHDYIESLVQTNVPYFKSLQDKQTSSSQQNENEEMFLTDDERFDDDDVPSFDDEKWMNNDGTDSDEEVDLKEQKPNIRQAKNIAKFVIPIIIILFGFLIICLHTRKSHIEHEYHEGIQEETGYID